MIIAKVVGTLVATVKTRSHENYKILVTRQINLDGEFIGDSIIALDVAQAGIGDSVLIVQEGNSIRQIMEDDSGAVDALIVGVVDFISVDGKQQDMM